MKRPPQFRTDTFIIILNFIIDCKLSLLNHYRTRARPSRQVELRDTFGAILVSRLGVLPLPELESASLLVYRAAWSKDKGAARITREAALAKMVATEHAQTIIDRAVQLHGGLGVTKGVKVEELYREIRALRIYEGATDVQKIVIAREALKTYAK